MATWTGAIPDEWVDALKTEYARPNPFLTRRDGPMIVARIRVAVEKLHSVSEAGRRWIVAARCEDVHLTTAGLPLPYFRFRLLPPPWHTTR